MTDPARDAQSVFGVLLATVLLSTALYGINLILFGQYYVSLARTKDTPVIKTIIVLLGFLTTFQISFLTYGIYQTQIERPLYTSMLDPVSLFGMILSISLTAFVVQLFFASRLWILSKSNWFFVASILVCAALQLATSIAQVEIVLRPSLPDLDLFHASLSRTVLWTVSTALADILITYALCRTLSDSRSGFSTTDGVLDKIIAYAIHRAAATSLAALATLILFATITRLPVFMVPLLASGQLYAISVTSMLLSRRPLQNLLHEREICSLPAADSPAHDPRL